MIFNSYEYMIFLPIVLIFYSLIPRNWRWLILLAASYWFYMSWKYEYIILIIFSTLIDWMASIKIHNATLTKIKRRWLLLSLTVNLGLLFFFKYYHFLNSTFGNPLPIHNLLLPVGISFYTFQTLSYTIDVYRNRMVPERHLGKFALYVSYFPQLVAGPIERAPHLLPQLNKMKNITYYNLTEGLKRIVIGLFKKIVIADRVAILVNTVYKSPDDFSGPQLLLATIFFGIQIYGDFSGYSDIAIGTAKIFGVDLMENFKRPYLATTVGGFWSRWHISLSSWFKDYVYIPLGGNRTTKSRASFNLAITFIISGLWHGANWTFIIWGCYHGVILVIEKYIITKSKITFIKPVRWLITMSLVFFGWMIFRANNLQDLIIIIKNLFSGYKTFNPIQEFQGLGLNKTFFLWSCLTIPGLFTFQFLDRNYKLKSFISKHRILEWVFYIGLIITIILMGVSSSESQFIYFQF